MTDPKTALAHNQQYTGSVIDPQIGQQPAKSDVDLRIEALLARVERLERIVGMHGG